MKTFKKYFYLKAEPQDVYNALINREMIEIWTGEPAVMEEIPGSEFSLWSGSICGKNLEFEKNRKIVQEWFFGELETPSVVTILLHTQNKGTSIELKHTNIPDDVYENMTSGWEEDYFGSLGQLFS